MSNTLRTLSPGEGEGVHENEKTYTPAEIVQGLYSEDQVERATYARAARCMLSSEEQITLFVNAGVIEPLLDALNRNVCADLQLEAAWAIAIITLGSYEDIMSVVNAGAIPSLVVLQASGGMVGERCAWALANIAATVPKMRDTMLAYGALDGVLNLLRLSTPTEQFMTALQNYCNFCRLSIENPLVDTRYIEPALPYISEILESTDQDVLATACRALKYLTAYRPKCCIEAVQMTPQLLPRVVSLLGHKSPAVQRQALKAIGNMHNGTAEQMDRCLDAGCLDHLVTLLTCGEPSLTEETAKIVNNIFHGTPAQVQRVLDSGMLQHLLHLLAIGYQRDAHCAIVHLCTVANLEQLDALISTDFLECYCKLLSTPGDRATISSVLSGLDYFLQVAEDSGHMDAMCLRLKKIGAFDLLEALKQSEHKRIRSKAENLLFACVEERKDPSAQPTLTEEE